MPIFFLGINFAEAVRQKREIDKQAWWMIIGLFALSLWACIWLEQMRHGRFPLYTERMLYIVLAITTILIMSKVFDWLCGSKAGTYVNKWFAWVGGISLEIYLVHVQFVLNPLQQYRLGYWPTFFATLAISLPVAWIISKVCSVVINKLKTKI